MTTIVMVRHGPTDWNGTHRLQGRRDLPLSEAGRALVHRWADPSDWFPSQPVARVSSPLCRAAETAEILFGAQPAIDARLIEQDWGRWEGETLADLRRRDPPGMAEIERLGRAARPPGGESIADVQARLSGWLTECGNRDVTTIAVCHKGVIRAVYALATGWDLTGRPPHRLLDGCAQRFRITTRGAGRAADIAIDALNLPLEATL